MRVVIDFFYDKFEQRCLTEGCTFVVGPYSEDWHGGCPRPGCHGRLGYFPAFGTERERSVRVPDALVGAIRDQMMLKEMGYYG